MLYLDSVEIKNWKKFDEEPEAVVSLKHLNFIVTELWQVFIIFNPGSHFDLSVNI